MGFDEKNTYRYLALAGLLLWILRILWEGGVIDVLGMLGTIFVVVGLIGMAREKYVRGTPLFPLTSTGGNAINLPASTPAFTKPSDPPTKRGAFSGEVKKEGK